MNNKKLGSIALSIQLISFGLVWMYWSNKEYLFLIIGAATTISGYILSFTTPNSAKYWNHGLMVLNLVLLGIGYLWIQP